MATVGNSILGPIEVGLDEVVGFFDVFIRAELALQGEAPPAGADGFTKGPRAYDDVAASHLPHMLLTDPSCLRERNELGGFTESYAMRFDIIFPASRLWEDIVAIGNLLSRALDIDWRLSDQVHRAWCSAYAVRDLPDEQHRRVLLFEVVAETEP